MEAAEIFRIVLDLNKDGCIDNVDLTIVRTNVDIRKDMCIWRGEVEGTGAPATIELRPDASRALYTGAKPPPGVRKLVVCPWYSRAATHCTALS